MNKNKFLKIRISEEEDNQIRKSAELGSITVSEFVRMKIFGVAKQSVKCPDCGSELFESVVSHNHIEGGDPVQKNEYYLTCRKCGWVKNTTDYDEYLREFNTTGIDTARD